MGNYRGRVQHGALRCHFFFVSFLAVSRMMLTIGLQVLDSTVDNPWGHRAIFRAS